MAAGALLCCAMLSMLLRKARDLQAANCGVVVGAYSHPIVGVAQYWRTSESIQNNFAGH